MDVTEQDLQNAIAFPLAGWTNYFELYAREPPPFIKSEDSMIALLAGDCHDTAFYRQDDDDPVSIALLEQGAQRVSSLEWTTLNENGHPAPSMEGRPFAIYRLPPRNIMNRPEGNGPFALRLGAQGSGIMMQYLDGPSITAPGIRRCTMREVLQLLENPQQIGYPATVNTDSCLGFATYAYQSAEVLFGPVQARSDLLIRLVGRRCKGHSDRQSVTQRAKVGYCPCCATPTHVAVPLSYELGKDDRRKRTSMDLWAQFGPWAQRRHAAIYYTLEGNDRQPLPAGWDWAANTLDFAFRPALIRGMQDGVPVPITTTAESRRRERQRMEAANARRRIRPPPAILGRPSNPMENAKIGLGPYPHRKSPERPTNFGLGPYPHP